jgi:hypothetical protein
MRYALWVLGGLLAVTFITLFAFVWSWYPFGSPKDGEFVHLRQSFRVWGAIGGLALDEECGRLVVATDDGVSCYAYPSFTHVRTRSMERPGLVGLLHQAVVVRTPELEVVLLDPETLEVTGTYRRTCRKAVVNQDHSILAILHRDNRLTVVYLSDTGAPEEKVAPFPNVDDVTGFAVLPDGEVLYSTLADKGLYRLRPPYDTPELIVKNQDALRYIQVCEGGKSFLTVGPMVIRLWDTQKMKPTRTVLCYWEDGGGKYGHLGLERGESARPAYLRETMRPIRQILAQQRRVDYQRRDTKTGQGRLRLGQYGRHSGRAMGLLWAGHIENSGFQRRENSDHCSEPHDPTLGGVAVQALR